MQEVGATCALSDIEEVTNLGKSAMDNLCCAVMANAVNFICFR